MENKYSILKKLRKKKIGYVGVDYTLTSREKKKLLFYIFSLAVPIFIGILIFLIN